MGQLQKAEDERRAKLKEKRDRRETKGAVSVGWRGFINWSPNQDDKADFSAWLVDNALVWFGDVNRAIENGFKLTLKFDPHSKAFLALFTPSDESDSRFGIALTMRGPTPEDALMRLVWAHFYVIGERYEEYFATTNQKGDFW